MLLFRKGDLLRRISQLNSIRRWAYMIKLLVADDHEVVRSGLASVVANTDIEMVGQASSGDEARKLASDTRPDVILLDIRMPDGDGLSTLEWLKQKYPKIPVLMLSTY